LIKRGLFELRRPWYDKKTGNGFYLIKKQ
jgi:hypothetical protein